MAQTSAIFASKLFKSSKRKDKIRAAYSDPVNAELVQQVDSYVNPKYRKYTEESSQNSVNEGSQDNSINDPSSSASNTGSSSFSAGSNGSGSGLPGMFTDDSPDTDSDSTDGDGFDGELDGQIDNGSDDTSDDIDDSNNAPIEESSEVLASTTLCDISDSLEIIKGTLNSVVDTSGVTRIIVKDKELWIYYNDKVNLNDVMLPVIDYVHNIGYTYLEFSRLARSDNAVVFDIFESSTPEVKDDEDGKTKKA